MSSTYLTSTFAGILRALAIRRRPADWQRSAGVIVTLVAGAAAGTLAAQRLTVVVPVVVLVPLAAVVACSLRAGRRHEPPKQG